MFFCLGEYLARIVGTLHALGLNGKVRGLPELDKDLSQPILLHPRNRPVSRMVLNLGE